jgi:hypothetical protein
MKCIFSCALSNAVLLCWMACTQIAGAAILPVPTSSTWSSQYDPSYAGSKLFDATVTNADLGVTSYGGSDGQWAGLGPGPHSLFMDFGATISANGIAYAQRSGAFGPNDKVGQIELWFSNSDFGGVLPVAPAQATVSPSVPSPTTLLVNYPWGSLLSGRYVAARFTALDTTLPPGQNNIGGSELRLTIPEPTTISMLALLGSVALAVVRSQRGTY